jgi:hypothetical protein
VNVIYDFGCKLAVINKNAEIVLKVQLNLQLQLFGDLKGLRGLKQVMFCCR